MQRLLSILSFSAITVAILAILWTFWVLSGRYGNNELDRCEIAKIWLDRYNALEAANGDLPPVTLKSFVERRIVFLSDSGSRDRSSNKYYSIALLYKSGQGGKMYDFLVNRDQEALVKRSMSVDADAELALSNAPINRFQEICSRI